MQKCHEILTFTVKNYVWDWFLKVFLRKKKWISYIFLSHCRMRDMISGNFYFPCFLPQNNFVRADWQMGDFSLIASLLPSNNCNKSRISLTYELVTKLIVGENISLFIYHDANLFYNFSSALPLRVRYTFSLKEVNWGRSLIDIHILTPNSQKNWYSTLWLNHLGVLTRQAQMINIFKSGQPYCTVYIIRKHFCNF